MREIKYQAYDSANAKMLDWELLKAHLIMPGLPGWHWREYTGLKDKNGKEGYHKDIAQDFLGKIWQIEWVETDATFALLRADGGVFTGDSLLMRHLDEMEIIGNIYENPELISQP